jgi:conjugative relaxase-like TrwC/TraI family protein
VITGAKIVNGSGYLANHLSAKDYYAEGEAKTVGKWIGEAGKKLGVENVEFELAFERLRKNEHPETGEQLTARNKEDRVAFFDFQFSAPKDVSVLAVVGGDERVRAAFEEAAENALRELEKFAAVRERRGDKAHKDESRTTGNLVAACFHHDASRSLDPQLHMHAVTANATWDAEAGGWKALQMRSMGEAIKYVRQTMYHDLAGKLEMLGYETHGHTADGFEIRGLEHLRNRFSKRHEQIEALRKKFVETNKREPTEKEVAVMVKESRDRKLTEISTAEVRARQVAELSPDEQAGLKWLVSEAKPGVSPPLPRIAAGEAIAKGIDHVFERLSVAKESDVLAAALELSNGLVEGDVLEALRNHPDYLAQGASGEMTLRSVIEEEHAALKFAREGRGQVRALGSLEKLEELCDAAEKKFGMPQDEPRVAGRLLVGSEDRVSVLIGDAGTGKTFLLKTVCNCHLAAGGENFVALGPTGRARDELKKEGFEQAATVQKFLVDQRWQETTKGRILLVDEAGMLSTKQMAALVKVAEANQNRLILVGDTKQHEAVERGNALRNLVEGSKLPVARLSTVRRQRSAQQKEITELLGAGKLVEGLDRQEKIGMLIEDKNDADLFEKAARAYARNELDGKETIVVIPLWSEIHLFNDLAREHLRELNLITGAEVERESVNSKSLTEAEKMTWKNFAPGDVLTFHKGTSNVERGESLEVVSRDHYGVTCRKPDGTEIRITKKQRSAFDVGKVSKIKISKGDKILIRANHKELGKNNGDVVKVERIEDGKIILEGGKELPPEFKNISYGHAVTSHKSQGASVSESILVMGQKSTQLANAKQFYVSNTRHKDRHQVFVSDKVELARKLYQGSRERELAREYLSRSRIGSIDRKTREKSLELRARGKNIERVDLLKKSLERQAETTAVPAVAKTARTRIAKLQKINRRQRSLAVQVKRKIASAALSLEIRNARPALLDPLETKAEAVRHERSPSFQDKRNIAGAALSLKMRVARPVAVEIKEIKRAQVAHMARKRRESISENIKTKSKISIQ